MLRSWIAWLGALAGVTAVLVVYRADLDRAHIALAYLMIVLVASSRARPSLGIGLSVIAFLAFNFWFVPPYHTLVVADPMDWLVLAAFLVTSVVAAQLLARAQDEAATARARTTELDHLSSVGAEALNAGRAEEALAAIADVIRATLGVERCEIYLRDEITGTIELAAASGTELAPTERETALAADDPNEDANAFALPTGPRLLEWVSASGQTVVQRSDGGLRVSAAAAADSRPELVELDLTDARILLLPLRVRDRTVGVLRVAHTGALTLDLPRRRFVNALSYYAALGVERVRLVARGEHAEALRRADELKDALLASVSHDLRTPLTTIKALAHDIRMEGDDRAAIIEEEADRLNRFVADLLDLSRLAGGAFTMAIEINAADDLVGAAIQRASSALTHHTLEAHLDASEALLIGRFDFVHSLRVLVNLLENAAKYSPAGSTIEVDVRRAEEMLEFVVADRGPGVPTGEQERIFEPFYRQPGSAPDAGGAGLGLSIAHRMAEAQGGSIHYEARDGGGSLFVFRVPIADLRNLEAPLTKSL